MSRNPICPIICTTVAGVREERLRERGRYIDKEQEAEDDQLGLLRLMYCHVTVKSQFAAKRSYLLHGEAAT